MTFRLDLYEPAELGVIVRRSARILGVEIEDEAADEIARRSRGTPRIANRILKRVRDVAQVKHDGAITTDVAREALELLEVDGNGLERIDRALLATILWKFAGGPVGLSTLAVALGEEPDTIEDVYEPYLLQLGFLQRTPRGRIVTELGREHVGAARGQQQALLSPDLWVPGAAEPSLDDFVERIHRQIERFTSTHTADQSSVEVELGDGERLLLRSLSSDPGYGFLTLVVHGADGGTEELIVPVGAIRRIALGPADEQRRPGFALPTKEGAEPAA